MASAQISGQYIVTIQNPAGKEIQVLSGSNALLGPGGSPDGAIANTPEKWTYFPLSADVAGPGYRINFYVIPGAGATLDASDAAIVFPVQVNGAQQTLGNSAAAGGLANENFEVNIAPTDAAIIANRPNLVYSVIAKNGTYFRTGGDKGFLTWENNA